MKLELEAQDMTNINATNKKDGSPVLVNTKNIRVCPCAANQ